MRPVGGVPLYDLRYDRCGAAGQQGSSATQGKLVIGLDLLDCGGNGFHLDILAIIQRDGVVWYGF